MVMVMGMVVLMGCRRVVVRLVGLVSMLRVDLLGHLASSRVLPFAAANARRPPLHGRARTGIVKRRADATVPDLASQRTRFSPATRPRPRRPQERQSTTERELRACASEIDADACLSLIHISEPTRLGMISYAVFCLKKKKKQ